MSRACRFAGARLSGLRCTRLRSRPADAGPNRNARCLRRLRLGQFCVALVWRTYAHASRLDGDNGPPREQCSIALKCRSADWPLPPRGNSHEPDDSSVRLRPHDRQLTEILVERDEHPVFGMSPAEQLLVAGVIWTVTGMNYVVSRSREVLPRLAPDAVVEQQLQAAASTTGGSTRSCATTRWA